jgi:membrane associated rhomboid family serine protease
LRGPLPDIRRAKGYLKAMDQPAPIERDRQAAFNAPSVIVVLLVVLVAIQAVLSFLSDADYTEALLLFSFLPARYDHSLVQPVAWPGGAAADVWTFVTYAFLHGDWVHLGVNAIWLLAFGSAVAWRFGTLRFLAFSAVTAAAGAALHLAFHWGEMMPVIGASGALSGYMAAAIRFMFQPGAPLGLFRVGGRAAFRVPAHPLLEVLRDRRVVLFLVIWFAMNLVTGLFSFTGDGETIAWQAHIGGFLAGLVLFPLFDPVRSPR